MKKYKLEELMQLKYGKRQTEVECEGGIYNIYGSAGIIGHTNNYLYDLPSVLLGRKGTLNNPIYTEEPFWCIDTMFYTEINTKKVLPKYLYYKFKTINFNRYNESTGVPSLRVPTINDISVSIHENISDQLHITNILGTLDKKIENGRKLSQFYREKLLFFFNYYFGRKIETEQNSQANSFFDLISGYVAIDL